MGELVENKVQDKSKTTAVQKQDNEFDEYPEKSSLISLMTLFRFGKGAYQRLYFGIGLFFTGSFFLMFSAKTLGQMIEYINQKNYHRNQEFYHLALLLVLFECLYITSQYFARAQLALVTTRVAFGVRKKLFEKISLLPMTYFDHQPLGRTITRLTSDVEGIEAFFNGTLPKTLSSFIQMLNVIVAMMLFNFRFGLMVAAICFPSIALSFFTRILVKNAYRALKRFNAALNSKLAENINGLPIIRAFNLQNWTMTMYKHTNTDLLKANLYLMSFNSLTQPVLVFLCTIPTLGILYFGGLKVLAGEISIALFVAYVRFSERLIWPIRTISQEIQVLQEALASGERVKKLFSEQEESTVLGPSGAWQKVPRGQIEFKNVSMAYQDGLPVIQDINFKVEPGMSIGLVGATGSGKTTTLSLIPGLYPIQSGAIYIDNVNLKEWDRRFLRQCIGMVNQDVEIFRGSLRDNLTVACLDKSTLNDKAILEACEKSGLMVLIRQLPRKLNTLVLDGGKNLSMGERQLIAFTRMLLRNPAILILDEATANIDRQSELLIQRALVELMKHRTSFIIAHRLNTIRQCDQILVFKDGRLIQRGTHEELMAAAGHYYHQLASRQEYT